MAEPDISTIPKLALRAKAEGLPISAYSIRMLVKQGKIPVRYIGPKPLVSYSALVRYLSCADGCDNAPVTVVAGSGIRRINVG